ncbi:hypothetical protein A6F49_04300 [Enteractinococcus helveticum]|uniref:Uncharacterized protein n=1 Tax=Enteractinococcus helveticum TaxID=1837282 RepID=A0A1B7M2T3_9MICC|nr:hypothetical protein A6F49_04300 [Enteractinococcus helveticum]
MEVDIVTELDGDRDIEYLPISGVSFRLEQESLIMKVRYYGDEEPGPSSKTEERIQPFLSRNKYEILRLEEDLDDTGNYRYVSIELKFAVRG